MEEKDKKVYVRETAPNTTELQQTHNTQGFQRFKKPLIYVLMVIAFAGCMYLIFGPKKDKDKLTETGLNNAVPQASDNGLLGDKEKAYEQELLQKKEKEKRDALNTLSDYFNEGDSTVTTGTISRVSEEDAALANNPMLRGQQNYKDIQNTLGNFYEQDNEKDALRREIRELRQRTNSSGTESNPMADQLAMMEKSYQMAVKYLPQAIPQKPADTAKSVAAAPKRYVEPVYAAEKQVVSSLYREQSDEAFAASVLNERPQRLFNGEVRKSQEPVIQNSIRACIHQTQTLTVGSSVRIRLLENARIAKMILPAGTLVTASSKIQDGRLGLFITSIEFKGNIVPVDIIAYDLDGQPGLNLPFSSDINAFKEIASGMSSSAGTNITLSSSTGQQLISDVTKGVVQGTAGYISKKISSPKVTLKAGYLLFLLPQK